MSQPTIYSTFTTALPGPPSYLGCALRRVAFPLDCRTPEQLTNVLKGLERREK